MKLGETAIRRYATPRTFERGRDYFVVSVVTQRPAARPGLVPVLS